MIDTILLDVQYIHRDVMHFLTSYTINVFASDAFLNSLIKIVSKNGSIAFLRASHISARVIMAFFDRLDLSD